MFFVYLLFLVFARLEIRTQINFVSEKKRTKKKNTSLRNQKNDIILNLKKKCFFISCKQLFNFAEIRIKTTTKASFAFKPANKATKFIIRRKIYIFLTKILCESYVNKCDLCSTKFTKFANNYIY